FCLTRHFFAMVERKRFLQKRISQKPMVEICVGWERTESMLSILWNSNTGWVLLSTMTLGIAAGAIGCMAYWERQNLMSDVLSHAALPGVVIAFLLLGEKNLFVLIIGAAISALVGAFFIQWIT